MDRDGLAQFLRTRRERLTPSDIGLPAGRQRRTPGLRREEVAATAGISVDYYTRLEQGRGPHPSPQVLGALSRALRLSDLERQHLSHLAGEPSRAAGTMSRTVPAGVLRLVDRLDDAAVVVLSAARDVLAWNQLAAGLFGDLSAMPTRARNFVWMTFVGDGEPWCVVHDSDRADYGMDCARALRAAAARYPQDVELRSLIRDLLARSEEFAGHWNTHDVTEQRTRSKRLYHRGVGILSLDHETLLVPEHDQLVCIMTAAPGTPSYDALQLLKVVGTQRLDDHCAEPLAENAAGSANSRGRSPSRTP